MNNQQELDNYIKILTETINNNPEENAREIKIEPDKIGLPGHVIQLIEEKQKIRKLYQRTGIKQYKTQYNKLNKQIKRIIKEENKQNWEDKCNDIRIEDNHHKSWNQLKTLMGLKRQKTVIPTLITKINDKIHKSITDQEKVETITKSLKDIFTYEDNKPYFDEKHKIKIEKELNTTYKDKLEPLAIPKGVDVTKTNYTITKQEIENVINNLNTKKAAGGDNIGNKLIKYLKPSLIIIYYKYLI